MDNMGKTGSIKTVWQLPHPPIVVPEVGHGREREIAATLDAMRAAAASIAGSGADALIVISPHAPAFGGIITINGSESLKGDLSRFGAPGADVEFNGDADTAGLIYEEAELFGIRTSLIIDSARNAGATAGPAGARNLHKGAGARGARSGGVLDHGSVVPLYFISEAYKKLGAVPPKLIVISIAYLENKELHAFGGCIARAVQKSGVCAALVTSGDLSHKLTEDGPYGYDPAGPEFDLFVIDIIKKQNITQLMATDEITLDRAAQCGFYGLLIAYGALEELNMKGAATPRVLSYEGTFGVGYAIAQIF